MINKIKDFFAFALVGGGQTKPEIRNTNIQRKEELRKSYNSTSNSDFNIEGGELYLKSSIEDCRFADRSNASVLESSNAITFASENIVGGGQLNSNKYSASSRSIRKGGEGNYASLMSSRFADTWTMLNSAFGGGAKNNIRTYRKGASRLVGRCVATSVGLFRRNLDVSFMRMSLLLKHEMASLWKEVADI